MKKQNLYSLILSPAEKEAIATLRGNHVSVQSLLRAALIAAAAKYPKKEAE